MPMLDVFNGDVFSVVSLTDAIIKVVNTGRRIQISEMFMVFVA